MARQPKTPKTDDAVVEPEAPAAEELDGASDVDPTALLGDTPAARELELEQGYVGDKVDPLDNEAYSLESGPDAPVLNAPAPPADEDPDA